MTELVELYSVGIKRKLANYWPAWLPSTRFSVGDIGILNGALFEKVGMLSELELNFYVHSTDDRSPLDVSSESDVAVSFKAAGETNASFSHVGRVEAGMRIHLGSRGAFVLQSPETFEAEIGDRLNLQRQIIDAFRRGVWEKDWLVITRLVKATSATVLISRSSNASIECSTKANLSAVVGALGSTSAGITVKHQQGETVSMIGGENVTPLFQLSRLKTSYFGEPKLATKSFRATDPSMVDLTHSRADESAAIRDSLIFDVVGDDEIVEEAI
jgi:hypothetical protein